MKIAVITPYADEPDDWLIQCHRSVREQSHPAFHYLVADGYPRTPGDWFSGRHLALPTRVGDGGHTPRLVGCLAAIGRQFDAVAFLDADNWFLPDHLTTLVEIHQMTGAPVCTSRRSLHSLDGQLLGLCENSDGTAFSDANCYFFTTAFLRQHWTTLLVPNWAGIIVDRIIWRRIHLQSIPTAHTGKPTICYRTKFFGHYQALGLPVPSSLKEPSYCIEEALDRWEREFGDDLRLEVRAVPAA